MNYLSLLSGSDVRGNAELDLTEDFLQRFASSLSQYLYNNFSKPLLVIGRDSRVSGKRIEDTLISSLLDKGIDIITLTRHGEDDDVSTTPMISEAVKHYNASSGIMITASHLPQQWNGLKLFKENDSLPKDHLIDILENCENSVSKNRKKGMDRKEINLGERPLEGLKIIVDAGNGASGFFAEKILHPLGADTSGSLYLEPDGRFPNHIPNPEDKNALMDLCKAVVDKKADLGIIFDTDGDRSSVVLPDGKAVTGNRILALVYAMILEEKQGSFIVSDSVTSDGLSDFVEKNNGIYRRFKRGYANVRNEMKRLNENEITCYVGGETSGHIMFYENSYADDGSYTVARLLIYLAQLKSRDMDFSDVLKDLKEPLNSLSFRLTIDKEDFLEYGKNIINELIDYGENKGLKYNTTEGIRISFPDYEGWALIRLSLHEPLLVINAESDKKDGLLLIMADLLSIIDRFNEIQKDLITSFLKGK
jgi:phosphomannomutase